MRKRAAVLAAVLMMLVASPALAQETEETVNGTFRLALSGEAPENVSFWVETSADGEGGVICTTDAAMVESGVPECRDGGATNEMPYAAPAGSEISYRILGSQGAALSQEVIAEGSTVAEEGFVVEASYTFSGGTIGDEPEGTAPENTAPSSSGAAQDQYEDDPDDTGGKDDTDDDNTVDEKDSSAAPGVLPDTGGAALPLAAGALLMVAFGGLFAVRALR